MGNAIEVFNNPYSDTESYSAQGAVINWGVGAGAVASSLPLIISDIDVAYGRSSSPMYPINGTLGGKPTRINLHGAASGQITIGSIYSPSMAGMKSFIKAVTKDCKKSGDQVTITLRPFGLLNCTEDAAKDTTMFAMVGVELNQLRIRIQGGEIAVINMPLTFTFTRLLWDFDNEGNKVSSEVAENALNSIL